MTKTKNKIKYDFKDTFTKKGKVNVDKISDELLKIKTITPENVVNFAKSNKESELFKCFEWNEQNAAYKWNIQEARHIINSIVIVEIDEEILDFQVRAFENVSIECEDITFNEYVNVIEALQDKEKKDKIFKQIKTQTQILLNKIDEYNSLLDFIYHK